MFVRILPGQTALKWMDSGARTLPKVRTKPTTALWEEEVRWVSWVFSGQEEDGDDETYCFDAV